MFKKMSDLFWNAFDELNYFYVYRSKKGAMSMTLEEFIKIILLVALIFVVVSGGVYLIYGKGGKMVAGIGKLFRQGA